MTFLELLDHFGSQARVAEALGIKPSSVCLWQEAGAVPLLRQHQIEHLTGGALRADDPVTRDKRRSNGGRRVPA